MLPTTGIHQFAKPFYTQKERHYHNWEHIMRCQEILLDNFLFTDEVTYRQLQAALYFHDIVYDPTRPNSENVEASAVAWMDFCIRRDCWESDIMVVSKLIAATDYTQNVMANNRYSKAQYIIRDVDLSILAADIHSYELYMNAIRKEYAHYNNEEYRTGRIKILTQLLDLAKSGELFHVRTEWNKDAVINMSYELEILQLQRGNAT